MEAAHHQAADAQHGIAVEFGPESLDFGIESLDFGIEVSDVAVELGYEILEDFHLGSGRGQAISQPENLHTEFVPIVAVDWVVGAVG